MHSKAIPVGSFAFWFLWKVVTILVLIGIPLLTFGNSEFREPLRFVFVFILLGIMIISNEELVYGHATEHGIQFRRYFRLQSLPWEAIRVIKWSSSDRIQIQLKSGILFRKELSAQTFGNKSSAEWLSTPPEVVRWLLVTRPSGLKELN